MVKLGDTFFFTVEKSHLWCVITPPVGEAGDFIMVNFTSLKETTFDESCILIPSDYPSFISKSTAVYYVDAKLWSILGEKGFSAIEERGLIQPSAPLPAATLYKIQAGALKSDFFLPDYKTILRPLLESSVSPKQSITAIPSLPNIPQVSSSGQLHQDSHSD
jgi:hypothetical protein